MDVMIVGRGGGRNVEHEDLAFALLLVLSLLLLFLPYQNAKEYAMPYNAIAALLSLTIVIDEIYDSFGEETIYEQVIEEEMVEQSRA